MLGLSMLFFAVAAAAQSGGNVAYQDDQVRFTVVTDGVIRLEWQPEGKFTDLASFVASERNYPQVEYKVRKRGKNVEVSTSKMVLTYKMGTGKLTADNLTIKATDGFFTWKPGMQQKENLKGTFRTLDGLDGDLQTQTWVRDMKKGEIRQFEDGVLAKDGWTLIDESENLLFDDSDWAWVKERPAGECQDWYFMTKNKPATFSANVISVIISSINRSSFSSAVSSGTTSVTSGTSIISSDAKRF